jgi:hypothetical protein
MAKRNCDTGCQKELQYLMAKRIAALKSKKNCSSERQKELRYLMAISNGKRQNSSINGKK